MKNMKKELFYFIDSDFELIKKYQKLGFEVEIDDSVNEVYSIYMNLMNVTKLQIHE
jgi:hypothetical protein